MTLRILTVSLLLSGIAVGQEKHYDIDPAHSRIGFSVSHMVVSTVHGRLKTYKGVVVTGPDGSLRAAEAVIQASSIDSGVTSRDQHLSGPDFLETAVHTNITFKSLAVVTTNGQSVLKGNFTLHGVTRPLALPFTLKGPVRDREGRERIGLNMKTTISRKDYGLTWNRLIEAGGLTVGDEVTLVIDLEGIRRLPQAPGQAPH